MREASLNVVLNDDDANVVVLVLVVVAVEEELSLRVYGLGALPDSGRLPHRRHDAQPLRCCASSISIWKADLFGYEPALARRRLCAVT